ncbi:DUF2919 family protein [Salmonella enterica]|nr:DUF2919 family protein [Salmonella enterica]EEG9157056.1 DUF2919 family protein [Salmonella enterica]
MRGNKETGQGISRTGRYYRAEDYDDEGNLKAPVWMWRGMLWLLLPWWLMAVGMASGDTLLVADILYPTPADTVISLLLALPSVALCAVYPLRGRYPRLSLLTYGTVFMGLTLEQVRAFSVLWRDSGAGSDAVVSVMLVDFAVLVAMLLTPRLWTVFGLRQ